MKAFLSIALTITCLMPGGANAQYYVQLEKAGSLKTTRFAPGDILTFQLKNDDKGWNERPIWSIDVERNRIIFPDVVVHVDSIEAIRLERKAAGAKILGSALQVGGINVMLFEGYEAIFRDTSLDWSAMAAGVLNIGVGTAIKAIFRRKVFRPGPYRRIRLLDLHFQNPIN